VRLIWTTDPHLNHVDPDQQARWIGAIASQDADGLIITGDISEGEDLPKKLRWIAESLSHPIYFVLGNHDFYQGWIERVRQQTIYLSRDHSQLCYLTDAAPIPIDQGVYLLGEDGWGDASEGDYEHSAVHLNDFRLIEDFRSRDASHWKRQLLERGAESADRLESKLKSLPPDARHLLIATHVPPFCAACWYEGKTTDENWSPFFVCGQLGKVLAAFAQQRPECELTVLCGHTHHDGIATIEDNLVVYTGAAEYGQPSTEATIRADRLGIRIDLTSGSEHP